MTQKQIAIDGMTCPHCAMAVRKGLTKVPGVVVKDVTIGTATVEYDEAMVDAALITAAIEEAGYTVAG